MNGVMCVEMCGSREISCCHACGVHVRTEFVVRVLRVHSAFVLPSQLACDDLPVKCHRSGSAAL